MRVVPVFILAGLMWLLEIIDAILPADLDQYGIESREADGLTGVVAAPFLHADFAHLMANTVPFLILGCLVALRFGRFWAITATIAVGSGIGVWLVGPANTITVGASGVVFGYLTFLLAAGVLTRNWVDVLIGLGVLFLYGGLLVGALPFGVGPGVSWQAHLMGGISGVLAAALFARQSKRVVHAAQ